MLSSDNGGEDPPAPPKAPTYPWIQMALPGGGIVSVPLESGSSHGSGSVKRGGSDHDDLSPPPGRQLVQPMQPTVAGGSGSTTASSHGGSTMVSQADLLTVAAGEPVTHFNLDQLLEIVQSFQLDTTMASHEEIQRTRDLSLLVSDIKIKLQKALRMLGNSLVSQIRLYIIYMSCNQLHF